MHKVVLQTSYELVHRHSERVSEDKRDMWNSMTKVDTSFFSDDFNTYQSYYNNNMALVS